MNEGYEITVHSELLPEGSTKRAHDVQFKRHKHQLVVCPTAAAPASEVVVVVVVFYYVKRTTSKIEI